MSESNTLEVLIAKFSLMLSRRIKGTTDERLNIVAALSLLSQAQLLIESNPSMSRLLYSRAKQLSGQKEH